MDYALMVFVLLVLLLWFLKERNPAKPPPSTEIRPGIRDTRVMDGLLVSAETLNQALDECRKTNGVALDILATVAAFDGRVSRDELVIIFWFCAKHGAALPDGVGASIKQLNAGLQISVENNGLHEQMASLKRMPLSYVAGLYGALIAMTCGVTKARAKSDAVVSGVEQVIFSLEADLRGLKRQSVAAGAAQADPA